jgi:oligopeptide/dipeptide ABC transporter ATP-binding protein
MQTKDVSVDINGKTETRELTSSGATGELEVDGKVIKVHPQCVIRIGKVVESAAVGELFARPAHPYTVGLFNSLPHVGGRGGVLKPIPGVVPSLVNLPPGCAFQERCFRRYEACRQEPPWRDIAPGHHARCWAPLE